MTPTPGTIEDTSAPASSLSLEELSARATPGPWKAAPYHPADNARGWWIVGNTAAHNQEKDIGSIPGGRPVDEANAAFIVALVNAYRSGALTGDTGRAAVIEECARAVSALAEENDTEDGEVFILVEAEKRIRALNGDLLAADEEAKPVAYAVIVEGECEEIAWGPYPYAYDPSTVHLYARPAPAAATGGQWETIETGPKDGTWVLLFWPALSGDRHAGIRSSEVVDVGAWIKPNSWVAEHWARAGAWTPGDGPTHWMPLPPPPAQGGR